MQEKHPEKSIIEGKDFHEFAKFRLALGLEKIVWYNT